MSLSYLETVGLPHKIFTYTAMILLEIYIKAYHVGHINCVVIVTLYYDNDNFAWHCRNHNFGES